jgi:hypothetical protein
MHVQILVHFKLFGVLYLLLKFNTGRHIYFHMNAHEANCRQNVGLVSTQ